MTGNASTRPAVRQYGVLLALSIGISLSTVIVALTEPEAFLPYFGGINPFAAVTIVIVVGLVLLPVLCVRGGFAIYDAGDRTGLLQSGFAVALAAVMIGVDVLSPFPADINVAFPESMFFYPIMGYVVDVVFHVLPLTLFVLAFSFRRDTSRRGTGRAAIGFIALIEPAYQVAPLISAGQQPMAVVAYTAVHIFTINVLQLRAFVRHDFISMYVFRIVYYAVWHVAWGWARLRLLF